MAIVLRGSTDVGEPNLKGLNDWMGMVRDAKKEKVWMNLWFQAWITGEVVISFTEAGNTKGSPFPSCNLKQVHSRSSINEHYLFNFAVLRESRRSLAFYWWLALVLKDSSCRVREFYASWLLLPCDFSLLVWSVFEFLCFWCKFWTYYFNCPYVSVAYLWSLSLCMT